VQVWRLVTEGSRRQKCKHKQRRALKITFSACAFSLTAGKSTTKKFSRLLVPRLASPRSTSA